MKILFYNWIDFLDEALQGGGVGVYQKNIIEYFAHHTDMEIYFLSSGKEFSAYRKEPLIREIRPHENIRRFQLINSEIESPGHLGFYNPSSICAPATAAAFTKFVDDMGGFDIIHFNNLEGLPAEVLELRKSRKDLRLVLSMHNYYVVCPQVNLWWKERVNCEDFDGGRNCSTCLDYEPRPRLARRSSRLSRVLNRFGIRSNTSLHNSLMYLARDSYQMAKNLVTRKELIEVRQIEPATEHMEYLQERRRRFTHYVNEYCDSVLAVSNRVAELAMKFGVNPRIIRTSRIGTRAAEGYCPPDLDAIKDNLDGRQTITISYLGYMRRDKGFFFLMDALEAMPESLTRKLNLLLAAKLVDGSIMTRLSRLATRFNAIEYSNGYDHSMLDELYRKTDLTLVPVLWEDALPQVAIESLCHQTPVLSSNLGGTSELCENNPLFTFEAGNQDDFIDRIRAFAENPALLMAYWSHYLPPVTMSEHGQSMVDLYHELHGPRTVAARSGQA